MAGPSWQLYIGIVIGVASVILAGVISGFRSRRSGKSTSGLRSLGTVAVTGSMIGLATGGASTIGTAQLAYTYGFSAWWFTLGLGLAFWTLLLTGFGKRLYESGNVTLSQFIGNEYGRRAAMLSAASVAFGSFLTVVSNILSGIALVRTITPFDQLAAGITVATIAVAYIIFGGMRGSGATGLVKTTLLLSLCAINAALVLSSDGGWGALRAALPHGQYFNLISRGAATDLGAGLSLVLGVMTTQTYFQVLLMSRNLGIHRRVCVLCGVLCPPIGVASVLVGQYMRIHAPDITPATALPLFLLQKLPTPIAGFFLGALLITVVGPIAGLSVGISTNLVRDIYKNLRPDTPEKTLGRMITAIIAVLPFFGLVCLIGGGGSLILSWSFLSLGLRGAALMAPLLGAVYLPGRIPPAFAAAATITGPVVSMISKLLLTWPVDPVFPGLFASCAVMAAGYFFGKKRRAA